METYRLVGDLSSLVIHRYQRACVVHIGVRAYYINVFVPGIPACVNIAAVAKAPYKIIKSPVIRISVVHYPPELFEVFGSALAPPEPLSVKFMEGTPHYGNACLLQFLQFLCALERACNEGIVLRSTLSQGGVPVEVAVHSFGMTASEVASAVPADSDYTAFIVPFFCTSVAACEVVAHVIQSAECRILSAGILYDIEFVVLTAHPSRLLLSRYDIFAIGVTEEVVK